MKPCWLHIMCMKTSSIIVLQNYVRAHILDRLLWIIRLNGNSLHQNTGICLHYHSVEIIIYPSLTPSSTFVIHLFLQFPFFQISLPPNSLLSSPPPSFSSLLPSPALSSLFLPPHPPSTISSMTSKTASILSKRLLFSTARLTHKQTQRSRDRNTHI